MFRTTYKPNTLVKATYPSFIDYSQIIIDDEKKTIIDAEGETLPFIEIKNQQHKDNLGKTMCVKNGVYQEFIKPDSELLQEAKDSKSAEITAARKLVQYSNIIYNGDEYTMSSSAQNKYFNLMSATTGDISWRLSNNIWVTLTRVEAEELRDQIIVKEISMYTQESAYFTLVKDALTVSEIETINPIYS